MKKVRNGLHEKRNYEKAQKELKKIFEKFSDIAVKDL